MMPAKHNPVTLLGKREHCCPAKAKLNYERSKHPSCYYNYCVTPIRHKRDRLLTVYKSQPLINPN